MKTRYFSIALISLFFLVLAACSKDGANDMMSSDTSGKGGSMARFTIIGQHLYVIDDRELKVFNINNPADPQFVKTVDVGFGIETIFPYGRHIFIGSNTGMYIYNIDNPSDPVYVSDFEHVMACDPVVVQDSIAYVTLRAGSACRTTWWGQNQLDIIDVHSLGSPSMIAEHFVDDPWGLGIDGDYLFICHGQGGLGVYDVSNPQSINPLKRITGITTYDVIPNEGILLVIGPSGFYQYDYSNIQDIKLISQILIGN